MEHSSGRALRYIAFLTACAVLFSCGGGGSSTPASGGGTSGSTSVSTSQSTPSTSAGNSSSSQTTSSGNQSSTAASSTTSAGAGVAARLAARLGMPSRLLIGLGGQELADIQSQHLSIDIYSAYLGTGDWTQWNAPPCDFPCKVGQEADAVHAVPMFTYYQMANNGDGNISVIQDRSFMTTYWARLKTFYLDVATYDKPVLVNVEPDFWGYTEQKATNADPAGLPALVTLNADCTDQPDTVAGIAGCILKMARHYAPKAAIGFPPSTWGANNDIPAVVAWMNRVGAQNADFIVAQTLDRDAGCFEAQDAGSSCAIGSRTGLYWDESNQTHPSFHDHFDVVRQYHEGIGGLPIIWWQTPLGVPSGTPGGTAYHYRDNRVHYFLTHPGELTALGGLAVVFSGGELHQTNITTDGGQFQSLNGAYMAAPTPLP